MAICFRRGMVFIMLAQVFVNFFSLFSMSNVLFVFDFLFNHLHEGLHPHLVHALSASQMSRLLNGIGFLFF